MGPGTGVVEDFDREPESLWELGSKDWSDPGSDEVASAPRSAIVHAESGMAYVVGLGEATRSRGLDPQGEDEGPWTLSTGRLLRVRPAYVATDVDACLTAVDPVRREATSVRLAAARAQVMAMTVLGDRTLRVEGEDWEYRGIAHTPKTCVDQPLPEPDPGPEDPGAEDPDVAPEPERKREDGGCAGGGGSLVVWLAAVAVGARGWGRRAARRLRR